MKKQPSILFITMGKNEGASRFRVQQYLPYLQNDGLKVHFYPLLWSNKHPENYGVLKYFLYGQIVFLKFFSILLAPFYDLIFIQRSIVRHISPWPEKIIRNLGKKIIFDLDDAIWLNYADKKANPVDAVLRISRQIIAGNDYISSYSGKFCQNVTIVPTPIDTDIYQPVIKSAEDGFLTIGWIGTYSNLKYLKRLQPVFLKLKSIYGNKVRLAIVCDQRPDFELGIAYNFIPWSAENEATDIQKFDIGIMPLDDTEWARGKCAFKAIQYMSCGLAVVASPVGANIDVIQPGAGILARTDDEWLKALSQLIQDKEKRADLGVRAREAVLNNYSVKVNYKKISVIINGLL
ncbi:MAG: glycosyltransferase family 4 protein [Patescibacteria group bacterium]|jgi:glycosyltransferase involved in cell wall biosynthesis